MKQRPLKDRLSEAAHQSLDDFLEPEHLKDLATSIIGAAEAQRAADAGPISLTETIEFLENINGGPICAQTELTQGYFLPLLDPNQPFMDARTVPGNFTLTPMVINPALLPQLAHYETLLDKRKRLRQKTKPKPELKQERNPELEALGFTVDVGGGADLDEAAADDESDIEPAEAFGDDIQIESSADIKEYIKAVAGTPIIKEQAVEQQNKRSKVPVKAQSWKSYSDLKGKQPAKMAEDILETKMAATVSEIVQKNPNEKHTLNDRAERKRAAQARRHNEADGWYGMKRQTISPEVRYELQALDLRGYAGPNAPFYRGAKSDFELAKADSGFFQIGIVKDDSVTAGINALAPLDTAHRSKKRKVKSLVKTLLA